jgi:L-Ala-D/L-Glu epimerase
MTPTTIHELVVEPLDLALTEPFAIAGGAQLAAHNVLVEVRLAGGASGLGEAAPFPAVSGETQASTIAALGELSDLVRGRDARGWRAIASAMTERAPLAPSARCALEIAILDALARHHGLSLETFFGGTGAAVETDVTIVAGDATHAAEAARDIASRGFRAIKIKVGALAPEADAERVVCVRDAAPHARLLVDANGGYDVAGARRFLGAVAEAGVSLALFEQPVPRGDLAAMRAVTDASDVPVCADESARTADDVLALWRAGAARAVNLKPMKSGVSETLAMWAVARAAGLELMIGGMVESVLAMSFSAHLASGLGGFAHVDLDTPLFIAAHPFEGGFVQRGPRLDLTGVTAGHGVIRAQRSGRAA